MIRILNCNLQRGRADSAALQDIVTTEAVDVVCAQELSRDLATMLARILPHNNLHYDRSQWANGIAARLPTEILPLELPVRDACIARLTPDNWPVVPRTLEIVNVHISAPHTWPYFPRSVRRRDQMDLLLQNRGACLDTPQAVVGDFNASPIWPVYKKMLESYKDGIQEAAGAEQIAKPTWPYIPQLGLRGLIRIDHVFLRHLSARNARRIEIPGTDHLAIIVDVDFAQAKA